MPDTSTRHLVRHLDTSSTHHQHLKPGAKEHSHQTREMEDTGYGNDQTPHRHLTNTSNLVSKDSRGRGKEKGRLSNNGGEKSEGHCQPLMITINGNKLIN